MTNYQTAVIDGQLEPQLRHTLLQAVQLVAAETGIRVDSAFALGSLTAGLGTPRSDLDCYVIAAHETPDMTRWINIDGIRVDIDIHGSSWPTKTLAQNFPHMADPNLKPGSYPDVRSRAHFDTVARLFYALPVIPGTAWTAIRQHLNHHQLDFTRYVNSQSSLELGGVAEDALGFLEIGDLVSERLTLSRLLPQSLNQALVAAGSLYLAEKWIWRRLEKMMGPDLTANLSELITTPISTTHNEKYRRVALSC